ncbi:hypothetical protein Tco_0617403 [Tanacetum coccineum]
MAMVMEMVEEIMVAPTKDLWRVDIKTLTGLGKYAASSFIVKALVGADHAGYTDRFHELEKLVPHLATPEVKHVTRYING